MLKAFTVVILGGLGSIPGAVLGGLLIGMVESVLQTFVGGAASDIFSFLAIMLVLLLRPWGLLGRPEM